MHKCFIALVILGLGLFLSGCPDVAYWNTRLLYDMDCRPQIVKANHGQCASTKKEPLNAQATTP